MKVKSTFTLDVGCSLHPRGDVNIDITPYHYKNFIRADARHLPFKSKSFTHVKAYNLLEHTKEPSRVLKELYRVAKNVEVRVDSMFSLANWFYFEHEQITIGLHFIRKPRILKLLGKLIYQIVDREYSREGVIYRSLRPFLVKAKLLDNWRIYPYEI